MTVEDKKSGYAVGLIASLTQADIAQRLRYLGFGQEDAEALSAIHSGLKDAHHHLINAFYTHLQQFPETQNLLRDADTIERLKGKQAEYFSRLTSGRYDEEYARDRLRVGHAHQRIGLKPAWYIGAYSKYIEGLFPEILRIHRGDLDKTLQAFQALLKIIFFDIELALDTYIEADQQEIVALKEYAENIICNTPSGLVVLDENLVIVSANRFADQIFALGHDELVGSNIVSLFPGSGIRSRANEVLSTDKAQYGITQELTGVTGKTISLEIGISPMARHASEAERLTRARLLMTMEDLTEQQQLRAATHNADDRVRAIMDNVADGIITIDENGIVESFNVSAERLFDYPASEVIGHNIKELMPEPYRSNHDGYLLRFKQTGERRCVGYGFREVEGQRKDGSTFPMDLAISDMRVGGRLLFIGMVRDITERKRADEEMMIMSSALEQTDDIVIITNKEGIITYVNSGFCKTTGYEREEAMGKTPGIVKSGLMKAEFYKELWETILRGTPFRNITINKRKNGSLYYEEKSITPLKNKQGEITHFISTGKDITERMETQERLQFLAHHDVLTTLPNRLLFMDRLEQALAHARRRGNLVAMMFMDLDRFKTINDSLGHHIGDQLLQTLSKRLKEILRENDTVARLSGDEFAILLEDVPSIDDIPQLAQKVLGQLKQPFLLDGHELFVTSSIGIALYPTDGTDAATLLKHADTAMYSAKEMGRNTYRFYTRDMNAMAEEFLRLENQLQHALQRDEFILHYQPQYRLGANNLYSTFAGVEALLRWQHPEHGLLYPTDFIPLLEETGLIVQVGDWILHQSLRQLRAWQEQGSSLRQIAVNISPRQFAEANLVDNIRRALHDTGITPSQLELEITETSLMHDEHITREILQELSSMGISLAMDDFGTGYSSLSYLRRMPINTIKIDKSFIQHIPDLQDDCELTRAITVMGHSLGMRIVAEGVQRAEQLEFLQSLSVDVIQGFLYSPAIPAALTTDEFLTLPQISQAQM